MLAVWSVPASRLQSRYILRFLKDAPCSVRAVEVRLFRSDPIFNRTPVGSRHWEPSGDLVKTAEEISKYVSDSGSIEATIIAADKV